MVLVWFYVVALEVFLLLALPTSRRRSNLHEDRFSFSKLVVTRRPGHALQYSHGYAWISLSYAHGRSSSRREFLKSKEGACTLQIATSVVSSSYFKDTEIRELESHNSLLESFSYSIKASLGLNI